jgi:hypothetical protein
MNPEVTKVTVFAAQVCVPKDYTDEQAKEFLESQAPCGTSNGWRMRKQGDANLIGAPERMPCSERPDCVHLMFDA